MKRIFAWWLVLALMAGFGQAGLARAESAEIDGSAGRAASADSGGKVAAPGAEMAQALSTVTGVAISPLLGASAVGVWRYVAANSQAERDKLPWFAQPWFWVPALVLVGLCTFKDTFGMSVPAALKKPFDVLETAAHKVSGLIAIGAFVPLVAAVFHSAGMATPAQLNAGAGAGHGFVAVAQWPWLYNALAVPAMMLVFLVVFLASNAINILILLSPFPVVDAGLKAFRLMVLSTVAASALVNPWVGAAWATVIIAVAWFISGWSLRLSHFGMVFVWEFFTRTCRRFRPDGKVNWMFLARKTEDAPIRSYGRLSREAGGGFLFRYRPWFVLKERSLRLPEGNYAVGKGLVYSGIVRVENGKMAMLLPPRYRSHEAELAAVYGLDGVRDTGLRAAFAWLKESVGFKGRRQVVAAAAT